VKVFNVGNFERLATRAELDRPIHRVDVPEDLRRPVIALPFARLVGRTSESFVREVDSLDSR